MRPNDLPPARSPNPHRLFSRRMETQIFGNGRQWTHFQHQCRRHVDTKGPNYWLERNDGWDTGQSQADLSSICLNILTHESAAFFCKEPDSNCLRIEGHRPLSRLLNLATAEQKQPQTPCVSRPARVRLRSDIILFTERGRLDLVVCRPVLPEHGFHRLNRVTLSGWQERRKHDNGKRLIRI